MWSYAALGVQLQLWDCEQHIVKQPPPLLSAYYATFYFWSPQQIQIQHLVRNMDFFCSRYECANGDNHATLAVNKHEEAVAGCQYLLEPRHI